MPDLKPGLFLDTVVVIHCPRAAGDTLSLCRGLAGRVVSAPADDLPGACSAGGAVDVVLVDASLSHEQAMDLLPQIRQAFGTVPVVVAAEQATLDWAVRLVRAGAQDYVAAPLEEHSLRAILERTREHSGAGARALRGEQDPCFCGICPPEVPIVGQSPAIRKVLASIKLAAESRCDPILILGETGTGKELAARAIHAWRGGEQIDWDSFVAVNCAALTANLLESELFGHVKGAFTGADRDKTGLLELAGEGTLFLDEISEMAGELQAKLLRVLQERTFRKVGGTRDLRCRATILASSNRDLLAEVRAGRFRKDLYYRLAVFPIRMPALRDENRRDDVLLLADYFLRRSNIPSRSYVRSISRPAQLELLRHNWPGNVRELRNVIDRALILETTREITPFSLLFDGDEFALAEGTGSHSPPDKAHGRSSVGLAEGAAQSEAPSIADKAKDAPGEFSLEAAEREFILRALNETNWQRTRAAALLGITRATLLAKLKRYNLQPPS